MSILPTGSPAVNTRTPPRRNLLSLTLMAAVIAGTALTHLGIWRGQTAPVDVAASVGRLQSVSYSPSGRDFNPEDGHHVGIADIRKDMAAINGIADGIRLYTVQDGQDRVPAIASRMGLKVS